MMTWEELLAIHQAMPEPEPMVLKLYYDDQGRPITYTQDTLDGNYIEVDPATFAIRSMNVRVVNGVLTHIPRPQYFNKLVPSNTGTLCHSQDVAVVVSNTGTHWKKQTYEN